MYINVLIQRTIIDCMGTPSKHVNEQSENIRQILVLNKLKNKLI